MSSENVLKKLLKTKSQEEVLEKYLRPDKAQKEAPKTPGRPKVAHEKKARNFTLCLAPQYLEFLDKMIVKDPKIQGRGRKIRFIIDRFIEHERRSLEQMKVLKGSLKEVQKVLNEFGSRVKKGEKLNLSLREKTTISRAVDQVHLLLKILNYSPKTLHRILPREDWAILSFALDWKNNREIKL
ncbi:MAG: hypothetical protein ACLGHN_16045 [Bacteriovoracia bacterium]